MKIDMLPQTWTEKLATYKSGEERVYSYNSEKQVTRAKHAIDRAKRYGMRFRMQISNTKFSIIREK